MGGFPFPRLWGQSVLRLIHFPGGGALAAGSPGLLPPASNFYQRIWCFLKGPVRLNHLCDHSCLLLIRNIILFCFRLIFSLFFPSNSVRNARYIKRNGIWLFFGVVPGLVEEIDKTQHGTVTAEVSTGSDMRTESGLEEGQSKEVREGLDMPFKRRGCQNWLEKERRKGCLRPLSARVKARRCQKARIWEFSSKGQCVRSGWGTKGSCSERQVKIYARCKPQRSLSVMLRD